MTTKESSVTLPTITLQSSRFDIRIDTGELLLPTIVLVFCGAYYVDTRGLPAESMLYAGPLLYATTLLAIITIFGHAVSFEAESVDDPDKIGTGSDRSVVWGVEDTVAKQEHPQKSSFPEDDGADAPDEPNVGPDPFFNSRSATLLVLLTAAYLCALYFVSFSVATAPFLATAVYLFGERRVVRVIIYSVGFTGLLWFVFVNWLRVPLP